MGHTKCNVYIALECVWYLWPTAPLWNLRERRHTDSSHFPLYPFFLGTLSPSHQVYNFCAKVFFLAFLHLLTVCPLICLWDHFQRHLTSKSFSFPSGPQSFSLHPHSYSSSTISSPLWPLLSVCLSFTLLISSFHHRNFAKNPTQICSAWLF